jgi:4-hydroxy-tetrahydrodipicolinate reductase
LNADCALYHSRILDRETDAVEQMAALLGAGTNVVVPWISALQYPAYGRGIAPDAVQQIEDACRAGAASLMMTGTDPGFFSDMLPVTLACVCDAVEHVRIQEVLDYSPFADPRLTAPDFFCFGQPLDHDQPNFVRSEILQQGWGATAALVAAALGARVTAAHEFDRRAPARRRVDLGAAGVVEPGTIGARWFGIRCETTGPEVTWEHVTYVSDDSIPSDWPVDRPVTDGYVVRVVGSPSVTLHCDVAEQGNHFWGAYLATATRCTNVIDAVCRAEPGIVTILDLRLGDVTRGGRAASGPGGHLLRSGTI